MFDHSAVRLRDYRSAGSAARSGWAVWGQGSPCPLLAGRVSEANWMPCGWDTTENCCNVASCSQQQLFQPKQNSWGACPEDAAGREAVLCGVRSAWCCVLWCLKLGWSSIKRETEWLLWPVPSRAVGAACHGQLRSCLTMPQGISVLGALTDCRPGLGLLRPLHCLPGSERSVWALWPLLQSGLGLWILGTA